MSFRIGVLEDENLARLTLVTALKSLGHEVLLESGEASAFLSKARLLNLDVLLLDLHLGPGPTGADVAQVLKESRPDLGIVFLTSFEDPRMLNPKLGNLVSGSVYLVKSRVTDISILDAAISSAVAGVESLPSPGIVQVLTDTQIETLRLVAQGLSNAEIAKQRFITQRSVEVTIARIAKTLGISNEPTSNQRVHMAKVYFRSRGMSID